ncbi:MAG: hypothetical protein PHC88_16305 [Terrimicrobiaceae bacterium]|nr:hypothetical protein [Terrimicrobiaceae bacterium]
MATQDIDFSINNYSVVWANNGTATSNGWIAGGAITYGFNLTTGTVARGSVFYVGGSGKLINGAGTLDISGQNWIRSIDVATVAGDGFGTAASAGVFGNGGSNADGIGVFAGLAGSLTASTVPVDAVFFGSAVGTAKPATGGYVLPTNDLYNNAQGTFGNGTNTTLLPDPTSGAYTKLTGTYDVGSSSWTTARVGSIVSNPAALSDIATGITVSAVPEPGQWSVVIGGLLCALIVMRRRKRAA